MKFKLKSEDDEEKTLVFKLEDDGTQMTLSIDNDPKIIFRSKGLIDIYEGDLTNLGFKVNIIE